MYITLEQTLKLYDNLISAKESGLITPFIVSNLVPFNPYALFSFGEEDRFAEKKAAEDFHSLCYIFSNNHKVKIKIDGVDLNEWIFKIRTDEHRFIVSVAVQVIK